MALPDRVDGGATHTLEYHGKLNSFIARNEALERGKLRTGIVAISGTDYTPPVPQEVAVRADLDTILAADATEAERALNALCGGSSGQFFWNGNKRTSLTLANKILLQAGAGMLTVQDRNMEQFNKALLNYYNTAEAETLKQFLHENAIQSIDDMARCILAQTKKGLQLARKKGPGNLSYIMIKAGHKNKCKNSLAYMRGEINWFFSINTKKTETASVSLASAQLEGLDYRKLCEEKVLDHCSLARLRKWNAEAIEAKNDIAIIVVGLYSA